MVLIFAVVVLFMVVLLFIKDMAGEQIISSRFASSYRPFRAETVVQHEYTSAPETIWKSLLNFQEYCLWFPGVGRLLPILDTTRYVHRYSFDRFVIEPGAFFKIRPKTYLPYFKGRIIGLEKNKRLEMEMRFTPVNSETVSFEINVTPSGSSEVICKRISQGLFAFVTNWGFTGSGSRILHNLSFLLPADQKSETEHKKSASAESAPQFSRETIIANAVQAALNGNMDLINTIADKPTRGLAKAALAKAKRLGSLPAHLVQALNAGPVSTASAVSSPSAESVGNPAFSNDEDIIAYVVNKALDGNMDPINNIPDKALRGKAKSALVKAKRAGQRPAMPSVSESFNPAASRPKENQSSEELFERLVSSGIDGNMEEINALEDKALRGRIKAAVVRAKRTI